MVKSWEPGSIIVFKIQHKEIRYMLKLNINFMSKCLVCACVCVLVAITPAFACVCPVLYLTYKKKNLNPHLILKTCVQWKFSAIPSLNSTCRPTILS